MFSEDIIAKDESEEPEIPPKLAHSLSGMGSAGKAGKYDGFGNTPVSKEHIGDKVLDMLENAISPPDGKDVVMKMCLASSTGDYEPIDVPLPDITTTSSTSFLPRKQKTGSSSIPKQHVPGKAGGGWESSDDSEGDVGKEQLKYIAELSLQSSSSNVDNIIRTEEGSER